MPTKWAVNRDHICPHDHQGLPSHRHHRHQRYRHLQAGAHELLRQQSRRKSFSHLLFFTSFLKKRRRHSVPTSLPFHEGECGDVVQLNCRLSKSSLHLYVPTIQTWLRWRIQPLHKISLYFRFIALKTSRQAQGHQNWIPTLPRRNRVPN